MKPKDPPAGASIVIEVTPVVVPVRENEAKEVAAKKWTTGT